MLEFLVNTTTPKPVSNLSFQSLLLLVVFTVSSNLVSAEIELKEIRAEIVWVDNDNGSHQMMFSQLLGDEWSVSIGVYQSSNALTAPALGTSPNGDKLLIWTEQLKSRTVLKYMARSLESEWSDVRIFTDEGSENFAASIVYDIDGGAWVFWSSARSGLSDIYMSRAENSRWTKPVIVHALNEVPDIHPRASLNESGEIHLKWTRYSFKENSYIQDETFFDGSNLAENTKLMVDPVDPTNLPIAHFLPENTLGILHFPTNAMLQSLPISGSTIPN